MQITQNIARRIGLRYGFSKKLYAESLADSQHEFDSCQAVECQVTSKRSLEGYCA